MTVVAGVSPARSPCSGKLATGRVRPNGGRVAAKSKIKAADTAASTEEGSPAKGGRFLLLLQATIPKHVCLGVTVLNPGF